MASRKGVALVTGGARRIGAAIVRDLAQSGFAVAIHHSGSREAAAALARELAEGGCKAVPLQADLMDRSALDALVARAREALGTIDLLVNNASVFEPDQASAPDMEKWQRHFSIHLEAPALLAARIAGQHDLQAGLIVNMIDQRVWRLNPNFFSYTLSKSALWTATRTMAQGLAPRIRVNAIGPGPTLPNERQAPADFQAQLSGLLLRRGPELGEFGRTIRYLYETPSITGQMIALDGGQHLAWETPDVTGMAE